MMEYITSDLHFGHISMCGPEGFIETRRHFQDEKEMNETLIERHNEVVGQMDTTIHLGDFSMNLKPKVVLELFNQMNGHFILNKGNHDAQRVFNYLKHHNYLLEDGKPKFLEFHDVGFRRKANGMVYMFTHYPLGVGEQRKNLRSIHGHIHEYAASEANQLNVGIDSPEIGDRPFGQPIPLHEAMEMVDEKWRQWSESPRIPLKD